MNHSIRVSFDAWLPTEIHDEQLIRLTAARKFAGKKDIESYIIQSIYTQLNTVQSLLEHRSQRHVTRAQHVHKATLRAVEAFKVPLAARCQGSEKGERRKGIFAMRTEFDRYLLIVDLLLEVEPRFDKWQIDRNIVKDRVGEVFGKFKRVRGEENEQSGQEGTRKNERTVIALVMPDAEEKSGEKRSAADASGRLRYRERNKFSCKANVDYPTVNVRGNYISQEEADCYCSYLRPSTTGSDRRVPGRREREAHGIDRAKQNRAPRID
ncbi:hypothetical protein ALC60_13652 [Trachymyrmex zeteki]|uniref:Uncharacterized protein n=1 Tax=Mycetomoellerius zeteki TaxID=64791 RepID=A0A151WHI6_9HYME|nr:hypothetical protein ALC60_13652 [Trachymyrmex zeteki]